MSQHKNLDSTKWQLYPMEQQLLMISNELNRAGNWIEKKDFTIVKNCYERALELTQLTIDDKRWKGRLKELARFNELLADYYVSPPVKRINDVFQKTLLALDSKAFNLLYGQ